MGQASEQIEYSVHVEPFKKSRKSEILLKTSNMDEALQKAEKLTGSQDYKKVEVKKKYMEPKTQRMLDIPLKTIENKQKFSLGVGGMLAIAVICGLVAFGLAYIFGQAGS